MFWRNNTWPQLRICFIPILLLLGYLLLTFSSLEVTQKRTGDFQGLGPLSRACKPGLLLACTPEQAAVARDPCTAGSTCVCGICFFFSDSFIWLVTRRLIFISVHGVTLPCLSLGGFAEFSRCFPGLCEGKSTLVPTCISQPCLPVANIGPTRILPNLYLGCQRDVLNKVGALKISFIAGFLDSSRRGTSGPSFQIQMSSKQLPSQQPSSLTSSPMLSAMMFCSLSET